MGTFPVFFSLSTSIHNIIPAGELKGEGPLLGATLFMTLKVWSSEGPLAKKALVNFGDIFSSGT